MTWQKIVGHISDTRIQVESKSGNVYPAGVEYDWIGESIYTQDINEANDHRTQWAWVSFDGKNPVIEDVVASSDEGPPEKPPWRMGK